MMSVESRSTSSECARQLFIRASIDTIVAPSERPAFGAAAKGSRVPGDRIRNAVDRYAVASTTTVPFSLASDLIHIPCYARAVGAE
jgi:hypothetical protein